MPITRDRLGRFASSGGSFKDAFPRTAKQIERNKLAKNLKNNRNRLRGISKGEVNTSREGYGQAITAYVKNMRKLKDITGREPVANKIAAQKSKIDVTAWPVHKRKRS